MLPAAKLADHLGHVGMLIDERLGHEQTTVLSIELVGVAVEVTVSIYIEKWWRRRELCCVRGLKRRKL